jgi:hypothetical protein
MFDGGPISQHTGDCRAGSDGFFDGLLSSQHYRDGTTTARIVPFEEVGFKLIPRDAESEVAEEQEAGESEEAVEESEEEDDQFGVLSEADKARSYDYLIELINLLMNERQPVDMEDVVRHLEQHEYDLDVAFYHISSARFRQVYYLKGECLGRRGGPSD